MQRGRHMVAVGLWLQLLLALCVALHALAGEAQFWLISQKQHTTPPGLTTLSAKVRWVGHQQLCGAHLLWAI